MPRRAASLVLVAGIALALVVLARGVETRRGCGEDPGCFGPRGEYRTLYGTETALLGFHAAVSSALGLASLGLVAWRARSWALAALADVFVALWAMALLAVFAPLQVNY